MRRELSQRQRKRQRGRSKSVNQITHDSDIMFKLLKFSMQENARPYRSMKRPAAATRQRRRKRPKTVCKCVIVARMRSMPGVPGTARSPALIPKRRASPTTRSLHKTSTSRQLATQKKTADEQVAPNFPVRRLSML